MNRIGALAAMAAVLPALAGCTAFGSKQDSNAAALALTSVAQPDAPAGGMIGDSVGAELDAADRRAAMDAEFRALEYGRAGTPVPWRGRNGRVHGEAVAGARYEVNDFACRDLTHTLFINDEQQIAHGTACRQNDGTWKTVG